ncbi:DM13 domain-containing protein [Prosthecomicrobium sp. N25]|uniref:DM13 domain-containing protein n=1 Tax=Prosthecomicrobium sp. N25 TaxID=3129254 RepID=UPI0030786251
MKPTTIFVSSIVAVFLGAVGVQFVPGATRADASGTAAAAPAATQPRQAATQPDATRVAAVLPATGPVAAPPAGEGPDVARPLETRPAVPAPRLSQVAPAPAPAPAPAAAPVQSAAPPAVALAGEFRNADAGHKGSGRVEIVKTEKGYEVRLAPGFATTRGPDLELWLVYHGDPRKQSDVTKSKYVSLGRLKSFTGEQTYAVPAGVDPTAFKSVVVWCEDFSVLFASAPLKAAR